MNAFRGLITAFSTFSRIPMPHMAYREENGKYAMSFFPLVGAVIGAALWAVYELCIALEVTQMLRAALLCATPVLLTGGIHLDGYCDTVDALSSYGDRQKKLAILKDSHAGAFAVIRCGLWLLCYAGACAQIGRREMPVLALGFVLSRALSGLAVLFFRPARADGMGAHESRSAKPGAKVNVICLGAFALSAAVGMIALDPLCGAVCTAAALVVFWRYRCVAYGQFGGFTGDLAGWFVQHCELAICLCLAITERMGALWF